jgi:hypothetical protein
MLPNNKKKANKVSQVYGIFNTGNNVFKLQMPAIGPSVIAITISKMPKVSLIKMLITKNPPTDKQANNLPQLC